VRSWDEKVCSPKKKEFPEWSPWKVGELSQETSLTPHVKIEVKEKTKGQTRVTRGNHVGRRT